MLSSPDDLPVNSRHRVLRKSVSQEAFDIVPRVPPNSEKLFENLPWLNIMADIAITAAIAEMKVCSDNHLTIYMVILNQ